MARRKGEFDMTKARARQRAKAKAGQKSKKREAKSGQPDNAPKRGHFDPGPGVIKSPNANTKTFGGARRGAARSR
jgi:hypothetical protein